MEEKEKNEPVNETQEENQVIQENEVKDTDPVDDTEQKVEDLAKKISEEITEMKNAILAQVSDNRNKDALMNNMHAELQNYKANLYKKITLPIFNQVIELSDNIRSIAEYYEENPEDEKLKDQYVKLRKEYIDLPRQISDILSNFFVETYEGGIGEMYDPKGQKVGGVKSCEKADDDNKVSKKLYPGYVLKDGENSEFILRKEVVEITKFPNN